LRESCAARSTRAGCRISTGSGIRSRVLYTNDEEVTYFLKRPQVITAIKEAVVRGDLLSRTIILTLEADKLRPRVFAALLSGVASALRHRAEVPPVQLPRMADFVTFVWRACPGLGWEPAAFLVAHEKNQALAAEIAFEADGLAVAVVALMALRKPDDDGVTRWEGISTKLLNELPVDEKGHQAKWWPPENQVRNRRRALRVTLKRMGSFSISTSPATTRAA
jgi:hypothetical protein